MAALEPVNAVADAAPGFVWRLQTEDGNATAIQAFGWDVADSAGVIINMSVWESVEALAKFVYSSEHRSVLRRRREWFEQMREAYTALWWIPRGTIPTVSDAEDKVRYLRAHGPRRRPSRSGCISRRRARPTPAPVIGRDEWMCPA